MKDKKLISLKIKDNMRYLILVGIIVAFFLLFSMISDSFFTFNTVMNIFRQSAALAIAAIGMTLIILTGGIDLSIGAVAALSGAAGALFMQSELGPLTAGGGVFVVIGVSVLIGLLNGFFVGYLGMAPFIVTLATMSLARGCTLAITDSSRIIVDNRYFTYFGDSNIFSNVPVSLLIVVLMYFMAYLILNCTVFGRNLYAIGSSPIAARASGINVKFQTMLAYGTAGFFLGISAVILTGRAQTAQPLAGIGMEFDVITAVVLGGVSLFGGEGRLKGTFLGVMLVSVLFTGLGMLTVPPFINYVIKGSLILFAVLSNQYFVKQSIKVTHKKEENTEGAKGKFLSALLMKNSQKKLLLKGTSKFFPGVTALDKVSFEITRGRVHALCGENGAGKSTLIKILSGVYKQDEGSIFIDSYPVAITSPTHAEKLGISTIYQELANIPELSIYHNVCLGKEISGKVRFTLDDKKMIRKANELLKKFNLHLDVTEKLDNLTVGQQQLIEIAKAYGSDSWVIIMDEPTSAISESDKDHLFAIIKELKAKNVAIVYITHRMKEIFEIADDITILRDGQSVSSGPIENYTEDCIIRSMVGREVKDIFYHQKFPPGEVVLEVKNLYKKEVFEPISFKVHSHEVLGFCGLIGAGRTEIMRCLFGLDRPDGGEIYLNGTLTKVSSPQEAIEKGILLVSEDRRKEGIIPSMNVRENITLATLPWISTLGWIRQSEDYTTAEKFVSGLNIRTPSLEQIISKLSGGNQQKVCLAKALSRSPKIIILDEPTRGIDVGAKAEIHRIIEDLTRMGMAVIMISSEMPEIMGASHRIMVLYEGRLTGEFTSDKNLTQEALMQKASGL